MWMDSENNPWSNSELLTTYLQVELQQIRSPRGANSYLHRKLQLGFVQRLCTAYYYPCSGFLVQRPMDAWRVNCMNCCEEVDYESGLCIMNSSQYVDHGTQWENGMPSVEFSLFRHWQSKKLGDDTKVLLKHPYGLSLSAQIDNRGVGLRSFKCPAHAGSGVVVSPSVNPRSDICRNGQKPKRHVMMSRSRVLVRGLGLYTVDPKSRSSLSDCEFELTIGSLSGWMNTTDAETWRGIISE
jgi:hypothetical protein